MKSVANQIPEFVIERQNTVDSRSVRLLTTAGRFSPKTDMILSTVLDHLQSDPLKVPRMKANTAQPFHYDTTGGN